MLPCREAFFFLEEGFLEMENHADDIQYLIQIVQKDLDIQKKRRFLEEAPARIKRIKRQAREMEKELEAARGEFDKFEKERRHLEREIKTQNDKIEIKRQEQDKAATNKVFRALGREIEYLSKMVDKEEERVLAILEKTEGKKKQLAEATGDFEQKNNILLDEIAGTEAAVMETEENLEVIEDEKLRVLPHLSQKVRQLYDRISKVKGDSGVANLVGDICQGCYSRVPLQKAHEIRKNDQILTCEVCGRILVYYEPD